MSTNRKHLYFSSYHCPFNTSDSPLPYLNDFSGSSGNFPVIFRKKKKISPISVIMTHFQVIKGSVKCETLISHLIQNFSSLPSMIRPSLSSGSYNRKAGHDLFSFLSYHLLWLFQNQSRERYVQKKGQNTVIQATMLILLYCLSLMFYILSVCSHVSFFAGIICGYFRLPG